jgi:hypothetical protein
MTPAYFRAYAYSDEPIPYLEPYYLLYSTACYDFCTYSQSIAEQAVDKTPKEIRAMCKLYGDYSIKKIDSRFSKFAKKTTKDAVEHLLFRKKARLIFLQRDITEIVGFLNKTKDMSLEDLVTASNKTYSTNYV